MLDGGIPDQGLELQTASDVPLNRSGNALGIVGFAWAKPTTSIEESASAISFFPFFSVGWLSAFEPCLCPFFRLCLPWYHPFLSRIDCYSVDDGPRYLNL